MKIATARRAFCAVLCAALLGGCASKTATSAAPSSASTAVSSAASAPASQAASAAASEAPAPEPAVWLMEPCVDALRVEPIYDLATNEMPLAEFADWFLAQQQSGWQLVSATGELARLDMGDRAIFCGMGHLFPLREQDQAAAWSNGWNQVLAEAGAPFETEPGHGGGSGWWVQDPDNGQVCYYSVSEGSESMTLPQDFEPANTRLMAVQKGEWVFSEMSGENSLRPVEGGLYAVADAAGNLLTDFVYQNAGVATNSAIAVQDPQSGLWGYLDASGSQIVPFVAQESFGAGRALDESGQYLWTGPAWPYPEKGGMIVVETADGCSVLDLTGAELIAPGSYEGLAAAGAGCVWAKQDGLWGLLRV